jgi:hypothetical protein
MTLVSATARMGRTSGANGPDFGFDFLGCQRRRREGRKPVRRREETVHPPPAQLFPEEAPQGIGIEQSARFGFACKAIRQAEPDLELDRGLFRFAGHRQSLPHPEPSRGCNPRS